MTHRTFPMKDHYAAMLYMTKLMHCDINCEYIVDGGKFYVRTVADLPTGMFPAKNLIHD